MSKNVIGEHKKYTVVNAKPEHIQEICSIFNSVYKEAITENPIIPYVDMKKFLIETLPYWIEEGFVFVALLEEQVVGYMSGIPVEKFFGSAEGAFIPLYGHGTVKENRKQVYQMLYTYASDIWVKQGQRNHLLTLFCETQDSVDIWVSLGFGNHCVDAICSPDKIKIAQSISNISVVKATNDRLDHIKPLCYADHLQYYQAPSFIYTENKTEEEVMNDFSNWMCEANRHLWIAYENNEPVGYMRLAESGESFISRAPEMMNITGGYVRPDYRNKGIADLLLSHVAAWSIGNGYTLCGVDFESVNVPANNFWSRYFSPYTFSMLRKIDDRIK
ncbi:GNAT superfamily N-acetyltransferase/L-amino acid N-acyltransferase YncA [Paenibacillus turicensis]|uniref:GNAT superfamily N-acetyltransferase/L-amino acid N-acyltransferase YncA n=1 Tax=Paenibacillus turicensis TaxID=160487 RepID=A0ABS4FUA2_9BACL|nr:GNAT family N-acetyltransferase [Paenibacillus turicensis]MBP1906152.1 GNAT superfamily N-acetyltransferase/L-amino acid N-acyltransferase YncA [Paenibacillus turicensis]